MDQLEPVDECPALDKDQVSQKKHVHISPRSYHGRYTLDTVLRLPWTQAGNEGKKRLVVCIHHCAIDVDTDCVDGVD